MSFEKFYALIDKSPFSGVFDRKWRVFDETDPEHFYLENIRSFLGVPYWVAKIICERGVQKGIFIRHFEYHCPNDECRSAVISSITLLDPEMEVSCEVCELSERPHLFKVKSLKLMEYFSYAAAKEEEVEHTSKA